MERQLRAAGTPERAAGERRYLKSSLTHLGASVPEVRRAARSAARQVSSHDELLGLVEALWAPPVHERRLCAALVLDYRAEMLGPDDLPLLQRLVREGRTWALVDVLAVNVLGRLLVHRPDAAAELDPWAADSDFWVRRAAVLSQIRPLQAGASFERLGRYAGSMLEEKELFVRKAIGWALRETARRRPGEVYEWLLPRAGRASGVTMREAAKYLSAEQRRCLAIERCVNLWPGAPPWRSRVSRPSGP
jgi:3-methyladenine DNA glycosylase AlkD